MESTDTNRGGESAGGAKQPQFTGEKSFKRRDGDRRGEGGLFGGYDGPDRRSGLERRADRAAP
jgi:hypothetical protein